MHEKAMRGDEARAEVMRCFFLREREEVLGPGPGWTRMSLCDIPFHLRLLIDDYKYTFFSNLFGSLAAFVSRDGFRFAN